MSKKLKAVLYSILPIIMIILCASMITYIFAATKSELRIEGQIGYERPKGTGTEEDPFLVYTIGPNDGTATIGSFNYYAGNNADATNYFASTSPQYYFKQANDISGSNFTQTTLNGFYDGNDYKFDASGSNKAIFSAIGSSSVTDSKLYDLDVVNNNSTASAGVVTNLYGTLDGVTFSGSITNSTDEYVGGLVSYIGEYGMTYEPQIKNCENKATIDASYADNFVGGLVGYVAGSVEPLSLTIMSSSNSGNIIGGSGNSNIGGLLGKMQEGSSIGCNLNISSSFNIGSICGRDLMCNLGGLIGSIDMDNTGGEILNCYNTGGIGPGSCIGGLIGYQNNLYTYITNCYNAGSVSYGDFAAGGLLGSAYGVILTNCYNIGSVSAPTHAYIGGIIGSDGYDTASSYGLYLSTCGASFAIGNTQTGEGYGRTLTQLQTQSTYSGWTFGTYGTATEGWCFVAAEILVNGEFQSLILPRLAWENLEVLPTNTVTYYPNGGTGSAITVEYLTNSNAIISNPGFSNAGKKASGWATSSSGSVVYTENSSIKMTGNLSLYAKWVQNGSGTQNDPYGIANIQDFQLYAGVTSTSGVGFANSSLYFKQTADITSSSFTQASLNAKYDGGGHRFNTTGSNKALFNYVGSSATYGGAKLSNLIVQNNSSTAAAGIAIGLFGTIDYCGFEGEIYNTTSSGHVGGIVSKTYNGSKITNSYNAANITSTGSSAKVGGIVGYQYGITTITECYNTGNITGSGSNSYVGGISGEMYGSSSYIPATTYCYNTGTISGTLYIGGITGRMYYRGTLSYCYNLGNVSTSASYEGSLVGYAYGYSTSYKVTITYNYYLSTSGPSNYYGYMRSTSYATTTGTTSKTLANMRIQSQYSNWTFGTAGTATSGWVWGENKSIVVNGSVQNYTYPRLWFEYGQPSTYACACGNCGKRVETKGDYCDYCLEAGHCDICGGCYNCLAQCDNDPTHCFDCCRCYQFECSSCLNLLPNEYYCDECGYCTSCCTCGDELYCWCCGELCYGEDLCGNCSYSSVCSNCGRCYECCQGC